MGAPLGASVPVQVLALLSDGTPRTRTQLAQALSVAPDQVGRALQELRRRGQVAITGYEHSEPRRWGQSQAALWTLTPPVEP